MKILIFDAPAQDTLNEQGALIHGGELFVVSDDRALDLLTQPHLAVIAGPDPLSLTRDQLNQLAAQAGVPDPAGLANKDAVIAALNVTAPEPEPAPVPEPAPDPAVDPDPPADVATPSEPEAESAGPDTPEQED